MNMLQDNVALVTGGASGIGLATAMYVVEEGAQVIVADVDKKALAKLEKKRNNKMLDFQVMDVTDPDKCDDLVSLILDRNRRLDVLVNSASITPRSLDDSLSYEAKWDEIMRVNMKGALLMSHSAVNAKRQNGRAAIVNLASIMGTVSYHPDLPLSD